MSIENICFCIPARYNSKRFNKKLLKPLGNLSCIERSFLQCCKSKYANNSNIFILTDSEFIKEKMESHNVNIIMTSVNHINGTERISKNLDKIPKNYKYIVNIQADEPFIDPINIDLAIDKHLNNMNNINSNRDISKLYYTTLYQESNDIAYIKNTSSVKVITGLNNNVLSYSRNIIPYNKEGKINLKITYKLFTGIYVFNRELLCNYSILDNTPLQLEEDVEQLKILEHGYSIKSYPTKVFNEISLNTEEDYKYLINKYIKKIENNKIKFVVFDLDGVFTDGKIYIMEKTHFKCYNGKDTYGLKLLRENNIKTGLITAHDSEVLQNMEHIIDRMDYVSAGKYKKLYVLQEWLQKNNISLNETAYIGDDLPDLPVLEKVGFSACPSNAIDIIKNNVDYICNNKGGDGAVREFCEFILNKLNSTIIIHNNH